MSMWSQSELDVLGVRTHLTQLHDESPGIVVALVDRQAERTMLTDRGANLKLRPEHVKVALFGAEAHFHLSGYLLLYEETRAAALHALKLAREAHMTVSVDPVAASLLERIGPANFIEWTRGATLCIPNESEAAVLTGEPTVERMIDALTQHYTEVVIKHGAAGSTWSRTGQKATHAPAPRVQAIDSTGAGDAFCAGFLAARLGGAEPRTALVEGNRLGALAVTQVGARPKHLP